MNKLADLVVQIELHNVDGIRQCFANGVDPNDTYRNAPLLFELISEYTRTSRFNECVKAFVDYGLQLEDKVLLAVLLNDADGLTRELAGNPALLTKKYTMRCAYTPLYESSLLHICAEFNHVACAQVLVDSGIDVNVQAGTDKYGFGGQTPIFHTVNQNNNNSAEMMEFFLSKNADLEHSVPGLIWGKSYEWETLIPAVNPVSYAMMGLLPQMHRSEVTIYSTVATLLQHRYGIVYVPPNVPNAYLQK